MQRKLTWSISTKFTTNIATGPNRCSRRVFESFEISKRFSSSRVDDNSFFTKSYFQYESRIIYSFLKIMVISYQIFDLKRKNSQTLNQFDSLHNSPTELPQTHKHIKRAFATCSLEINMTACHAFVTNLNSFLRVKNKELLRRRVN